MTFGMIDTDNWRPTYGLRDILFSLETILIEEDMNFATLQSMQMCDQFRKMSISGSTENSMDVEDRSGVGLELVMPSSLKRQTPMSASQ